LIELSLKAGVRALLALPLLHRGEMVGALVVRRRTTGAFSSATIDLLQAFAAQSAIAVQNARLFQAMDEKSRQLEEASRHKSQFLEKAWQPLSGDERALYRGRCSHGLWPNAGSSGGYQRNGANSARNWSPALPRRPDSSNG
jgi:transcriptional regulator with GAF, ATPase, and Fis domain